MMMGMHLLIGTEEFLDLIRFMNEEIQQGEPFYREKDPVDSSPSFFIRKV